MKVNPNELVPVRVDPRELVPEGAKRPFNSSLDSFGRGMTMAPASALLDAVMGQGEGDFGNRFKQAKAYYDRVNQQAQKDNPNAYMGGQIATGVMGGVAALPATSAVGPMSALSRGMPTYLTETLGTMAPSTGALVHGGAGVLDVALGNMAIAAATNADKGEAQVGSAMKDAAQSPYNLLGLAGAIPDIAAAAPAAAQEWRDTGNRMRVRRVSPQNAELEQAVTERHGSMEAGGEKLRELQQADVPGQSHESRAQSLGYYSSSAGARKGALMDTAELAGGRGDPQKVLAEMQAYRNKRYGVEAEGNAATRNVPEDAAAMKHLDDTIKQFEDSYRETYRPTGTNIEYQGRPQGEFGATSTTTTHPGQDMLRAGEPTQVVGVSRESPGGAQATDRTYRQPVVGEAPPKGTMRLQGEPRLTASTDAVEPNWAAPLTPETGRVYPGTTRPNPEAPVHVNLEHAPAVTQPGTPETATQSSLFPQATNAAGEWAPHRYPDAPPGTGGASGGPIETSTNVAVRGQPASMWSRLKTRWDEVSKQRAAKGYDAATPRAVIERDPMLRDTDALSNILRREESAIAERALTPREFEDFLKSKDTMHTAETFRSSAEAAKSLEKMGASPEQAGVLHPSHAGTVAFLERWAKGPLRSRVGIPLSDALNRGAMTQAGRARTTYNLTPQAIAAEMIRQGEP